MTPEEFRRRGHETVDWIADYLEHIEEFPVLSRVAPGEIRAALPPHPPDRGEPYQAVLRDMNEIILPGITHWQSPSFFGYFPANSSGPSILGELLSAGLGVQGMLWSTSPACTELETLVMDWLVDLCDLPDRFRSAGAGGGVIQDSASSAVLCAVVAARERVREKGRPLAVYASTQTHSSVEKAVRVAGLGEEALRLIEVDGAYALRPDDLARRIREDRAAGVVPCMAVATVGTTSSNAIDPVPAIAELCRREGIWLHVDAAMSGTAAVCPEFRYLNQGLELVDSYCFNPHKWMFVNFDCDAFYVADRSALIGALSVLPEYLRNQASESGAVIDYRDWQIPLGRRFRALKLWLTIRHYGAEGLRHHVREHVRLAALFAGWVRQDERFEVVAPVPLNLVCFRVRGGDDANQRLLDRLNASGELFLTHTRLDGRLVLRLSIGATRTEQRHVEEAWDAIRRAADEVGD
ncbi:MAG: aminotransferase class V-fold PLP-dependent enzyme [Candidatus Dormibacteraeota bacterium]|nr:aminotransferase class V-fold PLP-dependent enzyme [Candidatus Dormibacteraeota bacterium]